MPTITFVQFDGQSQAIEVESGKTLMQNVLDNMVPGIDADCGGACACGTCHCFIAEDWGAATGDRRPHGGIHARYAPGPTGKLATELPD